MANISSDTRSTTNIVEAQGGDVGVELEQKGQRLANSSASAEDGDLLLASSRGGEETAAAGEVAEGRTSQHNEQEG